MAAIPTSADTPGTILTMHSGESSWTAKVVHRPFVTRTFT